MIIVDCRFNLAYYLPRFQCAQGLFHPQPLYINQALYLIPLLKVCCVFFQSANSRNLVPRRRRPRGICLPR
jgi:hypothetical protein